MTTIEITSKEIFDKLLKNNRYVIVDIYGTWCTPCTIIAPKFEGLSKQYSSQECVFAKCNSDLNILQVTGLPTFALFKEGELVESITGADMVKLQRAVEEILGVAPKVQVQSQPAQQQPAPASHQTYAGGKRVTRASAYKTFSTIS
jgi:thioredoxin 1